MSNPTTDGTLLDTAATPIDCIDEFAMFNCATTRAAGAADDSRVRRFVASTAMRDRYGDEVLVDAWDTKNYMANPVVLWAHNYGEPPIGKAVNVERTEKALVIDVEFAPEDANPKAEQVLKLYDNGFMRAVSVGFRSKASEWIDAADEDEAKRLKKEPDVRPGKRFTKVELLELSCVPVPANPQALMQARKKGLEVPEARNFFCVTVPPQEYAVNVTLDHDDFKKYLADHKEELQRIMGQPFAGCPVALPVQPTPEIITRTDGTGTPPAVVTEERPPVVAAPVEGRAETDKDAPAASPPSPASGQPEPSANYDELLLAVLEEALKQAQR